MTFDNKQLFSEELPQIRDLELQALENNYLNVLYLSRLITAIILMAIYFVCYFIFREKAELWIFLLAGLFVLLLSVLILAFTKKVFEIKAYGLRKRDIIYRSGFINRSTTIVPFNRVQHLEIKNGPIERMFKLSSLKIYTAGGSQSDLTIPGLRPKLAQKLKEVIINKTSMDEEE